MIKECIVRQLNIKDSELVTGAVGVPRIIVGSATGLVMYFRAAGEN